MHYKYYKNIKLVQVRFGLFKSKPKSNQSIKNDCSSPLKCWVKFTLNFKY